MLEHIKFLWEALTLVDVFDILLVTTALYLFFRIFRRTRALNLLLIILALIFLLLLGNRLGFTTVSWLISSWWQVWVIALLVVFQADLRRAIGQLGQGRLFRVVFKGDERMLQEIVQTARQLLRRRLGGLIIIERDDDLASFIREGHGTGINGDLTNDLLVTIFSKKTPLHDGAVIVRGNRIVAAGCILPLANRPRLKPKLGTRHLAALGVSEESDAVAIVVSEDKHAVSVAVAGKITQGVDVETLSELLEVYTKGSRI